MVEKKSKGGCGEKIYLVIENEMEECGLKVNMI
jgi:hypothetical protein